jgi:hypothetical protein
MLLGEICTHHLKDVASKLLNAPLESEDPRFYMVEIVGIIKSFHVPPVSGFYYCFMVSSHVCALFFFGEAETIQSNSHKSR